MHSRHLVHCLAHAKWTHRKLILLQLFLLEWTGYIVLWLSSKCGLSGGWNSQWMLHQMQDSYYSSSTPPSCPGLIPTFEPSPTPASVKYRLIAGCCSFLQSVIHLIEMLGEPASLSSFILSSHILFLWASPSSSKITYFKQGLLPQTST